MKIRRFREEDASATSAVIRKSLKEISTAYYPQYVIDNEIEYYLPKNLKKSCKERMIFVAVEKERIIGTATLTNDGWIMGMFVHPDHVSRGIASRLLKRIEKTAESMGMERLRAHAAIGAVGFYKKSGYRIVKKVHFRKYGDTWRVTKKLS
jgi:GNAT superfamily N-acetyltransferase